MAGPVSKVKVAVRARPTNRRELDLGTKCCVDMDEAQTILLPISTKASDRKSPKTFAFDHCFPSMDEKNPKFAGQEMVFKSLGLDILENAFEGYNTCIFAYGQTGSGKSYTMMGTEDKKGIIPRLCDTLFERIAIHDNDPSLSFKVEVSYMEIYNEKVRDLLDPKGKQNLRVREHKIYGPYVDGLSSLAVSSFENINALMSEGNKSRTVAATNMNSESSRSHAVFNITLTQTLTDVESDVTGEKVSKISLVDLAGSERVQKTGSTGDRLREGSNINKSLTTLGLVISALADQSALGKGKKKINFVPYRDSVLTWLLKECLGGNSKTVMVATISPSSDNYEETLSTLRYADRAKRIVNHAVINEDPNARIIRELREEVDALKKQLKEAVSMKADTLKERLQESEKLMEEMTLSWEDKLLKTEEVHKERQQTLEKMGISVQISGIKVERNKCFLVNLNADPSLNELLVYYLKEHTLIGRSDCDKEQDIQLNGLGIMSEHCIIDVENEMDVYFVPIDGAKCCVNGSTITDRTALRHGDRILLGNYHFFRINCPRPPGVGSSGASTPDFEPQGTIYDFGYAQNEVMMKEMTNDPVQAAMKLLENQHQMDKKGALEKQREKYERELETLRKQLMPKRPSEGNDAAYISDRSPGSEASMNAEQWAKERDELFHQSLTRLREEVVKANALIREANFLGEEMGKLTEFTVTLQIPACNLTPNRKRGGIVSEPAIQVKRKDRGTQIWSVEKLENKIIDMREMYNERKEKGLPLKDVGPVRPRKLSLYESQKESDSPVNVDPFYESQENHSLIGVANIFLEVLFHDVRLDYAVPILSQQGEVSGKLHIEIQRISGSLPAADQSLDSQSASSNESSSGYEGLEDHEPEGGLAVGAPLMCRVRIKEATDLPPSLAHFVFCQYTFWGLDGPTVVPPFINPEPEELPGQSWDGSKSSISSMRFSHTKEFTVNVSEDFIEHALEGSLAVEVWGHRSSGFNKMSKPGWEIDNLNAKSRSLADRWGELIRKIEMWVEIHELNELGDYVPVDCQHKSEVLTGGIFQLRQGHSRRILIRVKPVLNSGTLPIICEAITSVFVGSICGRSKLQKSLDSYQDDDLNQLRARWSNALKRRHEYLDDQIKRIMDKQGKSQKDFEREASLINQWVSLTEERNAVLVPAPGSGIPGAPANWRPPIGMETHIPVLFMDLQADDMGTSGVIEGIHAAGYNSILPKEHGNKLYNLPIVKYCEKDVCAIASWDSSIHDSPHLNRVTSPNERIYLIVKAVVQLSHPAMMELVLRKRICVNIYKKQGFTSTLKKKIGRTDSVQACGVTYEIVSNIPKASEEPEDRQSLALMAASGQEENPTSSDGETYIEKYTRGASAVESILALDRLRQEVVIKEKLASRGRHLRKTASVPNISGAMSRSLDTSRSMDGLDDDFRLVRSESLRNLSPASPQGSAQFIATKQNRPRSLILTNQKTYIPYNAYQPEVSYPYGSSPQSTCLLSSPKSPQVYLSSPVGLRPVTIGKPIKALRPVREEQSRDVESSASKRKLYLPEEKSLHLSSHNCKCSPCLSVPTQMSQDCSNINNGIFRLSFEDSPELSDPVSSYMFVSDLSGLNSRGNYRDSNRSPGRLAGGEVWYKTSTPRKRSKTEIVPTRDRGAPFLIYFENDKDGIDSSPSPDTSLDQEGGQLTYDPSPNSSSDACNNEVLIPEPVPRPAFDPLGVVRLDALEDQPTPRRRVSTSSLDSSTSKLNVQSQWSVHKPAMYPADDSKLMKRDATELFISSQQNVSCKSSNSSLFLPQNNESPSSIFEPRSTAKHSKGTLVCSQSLAAELNSECLDFMRPKDSEDLEMSLLPPESHKLLPCVFCEQKDTIDVFDELESQKRNIMSQRLLQSSEMSDGKMRQMVTHPDTFSSVKTDIKSVSTDCSLLPEAANIKQSNPRQLGPHRLRSNAAHLTSPKTCLVHPLMSPIKQASPKSKELSEATQSDVSLANVSTEVLAGDYLGLETLESVDDGVYGNGPPIYNPSLQSKDEPDAENARMSSHECNPDCYSITEPVVITSSYNAAPVPQVTTHSDQTAAGMQLDNATIVESVSPIGPPNSAIPPQLNSEDSSNNNNHLSSSQDAAVIITLPRPVLTRDTEDSVSQESSMESDLDGTITSVSDLDDSLSATSHDSRWSNEAVTPPWLRVGVRVVVGSSTQRSGVVKFIGNTAFNSGVWVGVALDKGIGKHNGCMQGVRYFSCKPKHGIFLRPGRLAPLTVPSGDRNRQSTKRRTRKTSLDGK